MAGLKDDVTEALKSQGAPAGTRELWEEIHAGYEDGGSGAVWELLEKKVKAIRKSARAESSEMRAAAGAVKPKHRSRKRK